MAKEIEKKFVLEEDGEDFSTGNLEELYPSMESLKKDIKENGAEIIQGYLSREKGDELAAELGIEYDFEPAEQRLREKDGNYTFTIKSNGSMTRNEEEHEIPQDLFQQYWPATDGKRVSKKRITAPYHGHTAEIDSYQDRDLIVAEIETSSEKKADTIPPLGKDVTGDEQYRNKNLVQ